MTNAPVKLNLDTLEQPVLEDLPFHIALQIESAQGEDSDIDGASMWLQYPKIFEGGDGKINCNDKNYIEVPNEVIDGKEVNDGMRHLYWSNVDKPYIIYCYFDKMPCIVCMNQPCSDGYIWTVLV